MKMNGHREVVGELLLNRFGQTDMLGLSTARDLSISAIVSPIKMFKQSNKLQTLRAISRFSGPGALNKLPKESCG